MTGRTAVVLFNLGGPDSLEAVRPFLFNLFNDPAIIGLSNPLRWLLARFISSRRAPVAREIYRQIGGASPLRENTQAQADALEAVLNEAGDGTAYRCFIAMRYWHPRADAAVAAVRDFGPDRVVLLPLYPQYSGTTSGSSLRDWREAAMAGGLVAVTHTVCCYPRNAGFTQAVADAIGRVLENRRSGEKRPRILFSAHGLPRKIIDAGDPYQWQIEQSVAAIVARLSTPELDYRVCYQSRVGKLEWLRPYTDDALREAGREGLPVVVVPIAFTSEHSETLVELDIEYRELAAECGVPDYIRVDTVRADPLFIDGLAELVRKVPGDECGVSSGEGGRICPESRGRCALAV